MVVDQMTPRTRASAPKAPVRFRLTREARWGLIFALPGILFFGLFFIYPVVWSANMSLHSWGLLDQPRYIGFQNYEQLFRDPEFINSIEKSFIYTLGTVIPVWFLSLGLALVFNREFPLRRLFLTLYYIPAVIALTVWCLLWFLMYNPNSGLLTLVTRLFGFDYVRWLNDPGLAMFALVLLSVMKGTPTYMVILLAGLRSIPREYYEAAEIDGANAVARFRHITMPLLRPVMLYVMTISIIIGFEVFTPMYIMTNRGGPGSETRVLPIFIFQNGFEYLKMGYASAAAMVMLLALIALTLVQLRLLNRRFQLR